MLIDPDGTVWPPTRPWHRGWGWPTANWWAVASSTCSRRAATLRRAVARGRGPPRAAALLPGQVVLGAWARRVGAAGARRGRSRAGPGGVRVRRDRALAAGPRPGAPVRRPGTGRGGRDPHRERLHHRLREPGLRGHDRLFVPRGPGQTRGPALPGEPPAGGLYRDSRRPGRRRRLDRADLPHRQGRADDPRGEDRFAHPGPGRGGARLRQRVARRDPRGRAGAPAPPGPEDGGHRHLGRGIAHDFNNILGRSSCTRAGPGPAARGRPRARRAGRDPGRGHRAGALVGQICPVAPGEAEEPSVFASRASCASARTSCGPRCPRPSRSGSTCAPPTTPCWPPRPRSTRWS
jgi:hypothetical protein